jgi:ABC-type molybdate transport system substrate-binding protein
MKDKGRYKEIPTDEYSPIEQACVILSSSKNKEIGQQFLTYFKTAAVGDLLVGYGFDVGSRPK